MPTVTIRTQGNQACRVKAEVIGELAVHGAIGELGGYSVTHLRSGLALITSLRDKHDALTLATRLQVCDFTFTRDADCAPDNRTTIQRLLQPYLDKCYAAALPLPEPLSLQRSRAEKVEAIVDLIDELVQDHAQMECDLIGVIQHVILETPFANLGDAGVLSWFPDAFLDEALAWLKHEQQEGDADEEGREA